MEFEWDYSTDKVNWIELSELYRIAPLGEKMPADLEKVPNTCSGSDLHLPYS